MVLELPRLGPVCGLLCFLATCCGQAVGSFRGPVFSAVQGEVEGGESQHTVGLGGTLGRAAREQVHGTQCVHTEKAVRWVSVPHLTLGEGKAQPWLPGIPLDNSRAQNHRDTESWACLIP